MGLMNETKERNAFNNVTKAVALPEALRIIDGHINARCSKYLNKSWMVHITAIILGFVSFILDCILFLPISHTL